MTNRQPATARRQAMLVLLFTMTAFASALASVPQVTPAAAPRAPVARSRCASCDSTRARRELLATRLDSLRTEYTSRRRMTDAEREVLTKEMTTTIVALEELIDASIRSGFAQFQAQGYPSASAGVRRSPEPARFTVTVQSGVKRGYLGVTFDGPMIADQDRDSVRFFAYPLIAAVDPNSPADRAGVARGDTLIALNGLDVVDRLFSFAKLLVPDEKVTLKVRRQGDAKEFRVVVGEAPAYVVQRVPTLPPGVYVGEAPVAAEPGGQVRVRTPPPGAGGRVPTPQSAPEPGFAFAFPSRMLVNGVGGARLEALSDGLAKNLGVKGGLLVLRVGQGSPAEQWGMLDGDIILTAAGEPMTGVTEFARVVVASRDRGGDGVKVIVLRDKKQQELIVK